MTRLLLFLSLILLTHCELPMAETRELPEPPTLEVPVQVKATLDDRWVTLSPTSGFTTFIDIPMEFTVSSALQDSFPLLVSGGEGIYVSNPAPGIYKIRGNTLGMGHIKLEYEGIEPIYYPVMVHPVPSPVAVLGEWGNQGTIKRENVKLPLWVTLQPVSGLESDHCEILSFTTERISRIGIRETSEFSNSTPKNRLASKIKTMESTDLLIFDGIRAQCKGDMAVRVLNPMVFTIK